MFAPFRDVEKDVYSSCKGHDEGRSMVVFQKSKLPFAKTGGRIVGH